MRFFLIGLLLIASNTYAVSGKEFLKNISANYKDLKTLDLSLHYALYKGHNGNELQEEYTSTYRRKGKESYRRIDQTELINTTDYLINVNHTEKQIILSDHSKLEAVDIDLKQTLKMCRDIMVRKTEQGQEVNLIIKEKSDLPYSVVKVNVDKNYWIKNITFYYANQVNFAKTYFDKEMAYPKMVVTYTKLKKKWKDKEGLLNPDRFFTITNQEILLTESYANYELLDLRSK